MPNGWIAAQSITRSGVGTHRHLAGPSRRASVCMLTSTPTSRQAPPTWARYRSAARITFIPSVSTNW